MGEVPTAVSVAPAKHSPCVLQCCKSSAVRVDLGHALLEELGHFGVVAAGILVAPTDHRTFAFDRAERSTTQVPSATDADNVRKLVRNVRRVRSVTWVTPCDDRTVLLECCESSTEVCTGGAEHGFHTAGELVPHRARIASSIAVAPGDHRACLRLQCSEGIDGGCHCTDSLRQVLPHAGRIATTAHVPPRYQGAALPHGGKGATSAVNARDASLQLRRHYARVATKVRTTPRHDTAQAFHQNQNKMSCVASANCVLVSDWNMGQEKVDVYARQVRSCHHTLSELLGRQGLGLPEGHKEDVVRTISVLDLLLQISYQ
mmetsp:Transcript_50835/g.135690  ORF Transcript_50835/g.135690 Transcript_50835/m.135690 type:complete len:317 (+) Transcript_50835:880-1830(+)